MATPRVERPGTAPGEAGRGTPSAAPTEGSSASPAAPAVGLPPTRKGRDARRRLLDAGREVFGRSGYAGARVSDITTAADLSQGAFYRYFGDRHELLLVLLEEMLDEAFEEARAPWNAQEPFESVRITNERYFAYYERNRELMGTMLELARTDERVGEVWARARNAFYRRIERGLRRGAEAGTVRADLDPALAAELLGSMAEFWAFQRYAVRVPSYTEATPEEAARTLTEFWAGGVTPPVAGSGATPPGSDPDPTTDPRSTSDRPQRPHPGGTST